MSLSGTAEAGVAAGQGNRSAHLRAAAGIGDDLERTAGGFDPVAHSGEARPLGVHFGWDADAVVADRELDHVAPPR